MSKAIFLGTFDPPHKGHYNCVKSVIESGVFDKFGIEKIHVIPTIQNPNKTESTRFKHRYNMCKLMFKDLVNKNQVFIDNIESKIKNSYTYELLDYLHNDKYENIKSDFWWIITIETLEEIINQRWFNSQYILDTNKFIVVMGPNDNEEYVNNLVKSCKYSHIIQLNTKYNYEYHSSDIRKLYRQGFDKILDDTNPDVKAYILDNNLYWL